MGKNCQQPTNFELHQHSDAKREEEGMRRERRGQKREGKKNLWDRRKKKKERLYKYGER